ncbi:phosphonate metabolism transcriptional regulator PhnF [Chitinibacter bivalviorum]|uniref:Phosphonate metabolism transcriptional regulator PhnF n=1 Tax=Chitinibacter bivalviorum TaxID=2739434 RepID=A0A7H9BFZ8_9NEIS|nr:phosphonate metabolism transcriptional regulator PhnF [Chitinibacter bivalviorum]QLG86841.1 phosphonate metabolism transcriptional regulator PhnF [Chitinibacter bivalviorum]
MSAKNPAKWQQIAATLAVEINQKSLTGQLPIEPLLAERFTVNRHTVRRALQELEAQGLVRIEQGRGTFVQEDLIAYRMGRKERFSHSLAAQSLSGQSKILQHEIIVANDDICNMLEIPAGSEVLKIDALDYVEEQIVGVCTEYLPLPRFAGFTERLIQNGVMSEALRAVGIQNISRKLSRITARMPRPEVAVQLAQPKSQPVLYVESVYQDEKGEVIEYGITRFAANAVQLLIEPEN